MVLLSVSVPPSSTTDSHELINAKTRIKPSVSAIILLFVFSFRLLPVYFPAYYNAKIFQNVRVI
jgi:uncharacterized membrane protein (DUF485 family)